MCSTTGWGWRIRTNPCSTEMVYCVQLVPSAGVNNSILHLIPCPLTATLVSKFESIKADTGLTLQPSTAEGFKPAFFIAQPIKMFSLREKVWMWHEETDEWHARLGRQGELYSFTSSLYQSLTVNSHTRKSTNIGQACSNTFLKCSLEIYNIWILSVRNGLCNY